MFKKESIFLTLNNIVLPLYAQHAKLEYEKSEVSLRNN